MTGGSLRSGGTIGARTTVHYHIIGFAKFVSTEYHGMTNCVAVYNV